MNKEQEVTLLYQLIEKHYGSGVLMQFEDLTETDNDQLLNRIETMTTYNTYQEAKIANPDKEIIRFDKQDEFKAVGNDELSAYLTTWTKCNPADHCMTVEKFLSDGYEFVEGDCYIDMFGDTQRVGGDLPPSGVNKPDEDDCKRHVLRAAALETKEPKRTKVEWLHVHHAEAVHYFSIEGFNLYDEPNGSKYNELQDYINNLQDNGTSSLYRKIETPIEWWEDAAEFIKQHGFACFANGKLEAQVSMTHDQWCDFARILLEQGE